MEKKEFTIAEAFKALNEVDDIFTSIPIKKKKLDEGYSIDINSAKSAEELKDKLAQEEKDDPIEVIDVNADTLEHIKENKDYVGQMIVKCKACQSLKFIDAEDLVASEEDENVYNVEDECPNCHLERKGFEIVGQVGKVPTVEPTIENDTKSSEEATLDNDVKPEAKPVEAEPESEVEPEPEVDNTIEDEEETPFEETVAEDDTEELDLPSLGDEFDSDETEEDDTEEKDDTEEPKNKDKKVKEALEDKIEDANLNTDRSDLIVDSKVNDDVTITNSKIWNPDFYLKKEPNYEKARNDIRIMTKNANVDVYDIKISVYGSYIKFNPSNVKFDARQLKQILTQVLQQINRSLTVSSIRSRGGTVTFEIAGYQYLQEKYKVFDATKDANLNIDWSDLVERGKPINRLSLIKNVVQKYNISIDAARKAVENAIDNSKLGHNSSGVWLLDSIDEAVKANVNDTDEDAEEDKEAEEFKVKDLLDLILEGDTKDLTVFDSSAEDVRKIYEGEASEILSNIKDAKVESFRAPKLIINISEEGKIELDSIINLLPEEGEVTLFDIDKDEEVLTGIKEDIADVFEDVLVLSLEVPSDLIINIKAEDEVAIDKEVTTEDSLVEDIIKANGLSSLRIKNINANEYWINESIQTREDLNIIYDNFILPTSNKALIEKFKKVTGFKDIIDEAVEKMGESVELKSESDQLNSGAAAIDKELVNQNINEVTITDDNYLGQIGIMFDSKEDREKGKVIIKGVFEKLNWHPTKIEDIEENGKFGVTYNNIEAKAVVGQKVKEGKVTSCKDRKELAEVITEYKNNNKPFKVRRSVTEGYRYDLIEEIENKEVTPNALVVAPSLAVGENEFVRNLKRVVQDIVNALKRYYNVDAIPEAVVADIIQDLRLIRGDLTPEELEDTPVNSVTKDMFKSYNEFYEAFDEILSFFTGETVETTSEQKLEQALKMLQSPNFSTANIHKGIASTRFLQAAQRGEIPFIAAEDVPMLESLTEALTINEELTPKQEDCQAVIKSAVAGLTQDEWEATKGYTDAINLIKAACAEAGCPCGEKVNSLLADIRDEELVHVGELEKAIDSVDDAIAAIDDGRKEAEDKLDTEEDSADEDEVIDIVDDEEEKDVKESLDFNPDDATSDLIDAQADEYEKEKAIEDELNESVGTASGREAYLMGKVIQGMNDEGAYYNSGWLYYWPDGDIENEKDANEYFGSEEDKEMFDELKAKFEKVYKNKEYHEGGLFNVDEETAKFAHKVDKRLGLPEIAVLKNSAKEEIEEEVDGEEFNSDQFDDEINEYFYEAYDDTILYTSERGSKDKEGNIILEGLLEDEGGTRSVKFLLKPDKALNESVDQKTYKVYNNLSEEVFEFSF